MAHKHAIKYAAALGAIFLASAQAWAQPAIPSSPADGVGPFPAGTNGGLIVEVYNGTTQTSILEYLGINWDQFQPEQVTGASGTGVLNFGTLNNWNSILGAGGSTTGVRWGIWAVNNDGGDYTQRGVLYTRFNTTANTTNGGMDSAVNGYQTLIDTVLNDSLGCNSISPCTAANNTEPDYVGNSPFPKTVGTQQAVSTSASLNTAINFFRVVGSSDAAGDNATITQYKNASGQAAFWTLSSAGLLTYTVPAVTGVPLPAAVWLLMSGLAGFGAISRRRNGAAA